MGRTLTASQWADELNIKPLTLLARLRAKWSIEKTLTTPLKTNNKNTL
jgi:hypothetical protein